MTADKRKHLERIKATLTPGLFAEHASGGKWRMGRHHAVIDRALCDVATKPGGRLVIEMPPRHGKSMLASEYFPAWYLGTFPDRNIIMASATADLSKKFSASARDTVAEWGPECFGMDLEEDQQAMESWAVTTGGEVRAVSVGKSVFGFGASCVLIDDYFGKIDDALSLTERNRVHRWYHGTIRNRLTPEGSVVIVATRYHRDDLIGRLLQEEGGSDWRRIRFPALAEEHDELGRQPGDALWPEFGFTREKLLKTRQEYYNSGYPWQWEALYQQNPPETIDSEFDAAYFGPHIWFDEWPSHQDTLLKVAALDPSLGKNDKSDYSAITWLAVKSDGTVWVDANLARRDAFQTVRDLFSISKAFGAEYIGIESIAFQDVLRDIFEKRVHEEGFAANVHGVSSHKLSKLVRIRKTLTPYLAQSRLRFKRHSGGANLLLEQLRAFPSGQHDDGPDSLEMGLTLMRDVLDGRLAKASGNQYSQVEA